MGKKILIAIAGAAALGVFLSRGDWSSKDDNYTPELVQKVEKSADRPAQATIAQLPSADISFKEVPCREKDRDFSSIDSIVDKATNKNGVSPEKLMLTLKKNLESAGYNTAGTTSDPKQIFSSILDYYINNNTWLAMVTEDGQKKVEQLIRIPAEERYRISISLLDSVEASNIPVYLLEKRPPYAASAFETRRGIFIVKEDIKNTADDVCSEDDLIRDLALHEATHISDRTAGLRRDEYSWSSGGLDLMAVSMEEARAHLVQIAYGNCPLHALGFLYASNNKQYEFAQFMIERSFTDIWKRKPFSVDSGGLIINAEVDEVRKAAITTFIGLEKSLTERNKK